MLESHWVGVQQRCEDVTMLAPIPGAVEEHFDNLRLQERVLDIPGRCEEGQTPDQHLILAG